NTVDLFFWDTDVAGELEIIVSLPLTPTGTENPVLYIYDAGFNLLAFSDDSGGTLLPEIVIDLPQGDYIAVVSSSGLGANQFPPFHSNGAPDQAWTYEIGFSGVPVVDIGCILEGNLDGSRNQTVRSGDPACVLPVPEPA